MKLPLLTIAAVAVLAVLLPLPLQLTGDGSFMHPVLAAVYIPGMVRWLLLHPLFVTPLAYYLVLRLAYLALGYPVRRFFLRFGLHVGRFRGSSFGRLGLTFRLRGNVAMAVEVDEIGVDIRTMRRLRMRLRTQWMRLKHRIWAAPAEHAYAEASVADEPSAQQPETAESASTTRTSTESCPPGPAPRRGAESSGSGGGALSKRLELYARGVRIYLYAAPSADRKDSDGGDPHWLYDGPGDSNAPPSQAVPPDEPRGTETGGRVLDRETHELAARLAKKISAILRTYAYVASLFAQWVDISVSDISLKVARPGEMKLDRHGITVHVAKATLWAESARASRNANQSNAWTRTGIRNSLRGALDWFLGMWNVRPNDQEMGADGTRDEPATHERLHRLARVLRRRRSQKYLSTLALEATGIRLFAGIDSDQKHSNTRWELVKMLVMQDMVTGHDGSDSTVAHRRGPVATCQRCVVRNDVITTFWGLPKKVDQSIEFGATHVRAGVVSSLLEEIDHLRLDPGVSTTGRQTRGHRRQPDPLASAPADLKGRERAEADGAAAEAAEARRQVNRMLFLVHEVLSQLRLEHVGLALRISELVVDLPLTADKGTLVVQAPGMLRWRQQNVDIEAGYMWSSISSARGSTVNASRMASEDHGTDDDQQGVWPEDVDGVFSSGFSRKTLRRPKDSTAFVRAALGSSQAIALRSPSMTSDPRAEELQPNTPGFRMGQCTLYGEMSAFLSEDLSQMPSPQPTVLVDVGRPELLLDLPTQLAFDEAGRWAAQTSARLRKGSWAHSALPAAGGAINHHLHALVDLVLSDVKAQLIVERAAYVVLPQVASAAADSGQIALRMHHLECHLMWNLVGRRGGLSLMPAIKFRMTTSPIAARWERQSATAPHREILQAKRGIRAVGSVDLCIGPMADGRPRANIDATIDAGEVLATLREHEFRTWLAMQPLWLATRIIHAVPKEAKAQGSSAGEHSQPDGAPDTPLPPMPPPEERRKALTATASVRFDNVWATVMACDSDEDVRSGIEHGVQISLARGTFAVRANGGSAESPHPFGLRGDAAVLTFSVECQRAQMFLLSAVPAGAARPETRQYSGIPAGFSQEALCGWLPDMVQEHITLVRPLLNFSRRKLEPHRARMIVELDAASISGVTSVDSVYRWAVVMHHVNYWRRRRKLARRMATRSEAPSPPDDLLVSIRGELVDLRGDLASPAFFDIDRGFAIEKTRASQKPPQLKLKVPQLCLDIEKTRDGTSGDLVVSARGPIATLYASSTPKGQTQRMGMHPFVCLDECRASLRFRRKGRSEELGSEQGVRANSTYNRIDVAFSRGAMAFGHRHNMAETIDGFTLMQKGCKRIARKSMATCLPPAPTVPSARAPTPRQLLAALGDPRTFTPPALRSPSKVKPLPTPKLRVPDDIPTIELHGPELTIMVHDDPFETALAQIYQVGLREQRERLSRLEAFEARASEIRSARMQTARQRSGKMQGRRHPQTSWRRHGRLAARRRRQSGHQPSGDMRATRDTAQSSSAEQLRSTPPAGQRPRMAGTHTFAAPSNRHSLEAATPPPGVGDLRSLKDVASASLQDVALATHGRRGVRRADAAGASADSPLQSSPSLAAAASDTNDYYSSDGDEGDDADSVEAEIHAAFQRLMRVESSEWIKAIRRKMVPPEEGGCERQPGGMRFDAIFEMPATDSAGYSEQLCGSPTAKPPYNYSPGVWTHPPVPLSRLVLAPVWITLDTPLPLLEFAKIESYLRYLDPATPHRLEWSTLMPMRLRIKGGDVRMQLRDFPFPVFQVPDSRGGGAVPASYAELNGGVEVSGSLIVAERVAHERSLRSVFIPIGPRARDSDVDLPHVGWYMAKSLQFPRIFTALSIMMFSAPPTVGDGSQAHLPPLPIMSTWGACYQPVISALMQRLESATSKSADVSPSLPWWDKVRSRLHVKCRMAVIEVSPPAAECGASTGSEPGQMFCLALDGRDPYQVARRPGSYLFTMRGGVRMCVNEGAPSKELWDVHSGRGVYTVPTEADAPVASATLSELMQLRCDEFLMGVPIIVDRKAGPPKPTDLFAGGANGTMRYTFITRDLDQLYYKVLLHFAGGVRMGIGLSAYIPPDTTGLRHNHWEVQPIAPESARAMSVLGISDAYAGYRSTRLHASVTFLCPFTSTEGAAPRPFAELYLARTEDHELRLRGPTERVLQKLPDNWSVFDVDSLVSPMHSLFTDAPGSPDLFFVPFTQQPDDASTRSMPAPPAETRVHKLPQCRISASAAVIHGVLAYLPLYVSRMMLPVRKGSLYPFTETSDNKIAKFLRSMRLVLDLKSVELAYSQRDYEVKELETRELNILEDVGPRLSPTPSDTSSHAPASGAKAEGMVRELKARVDSFSFNLLLEQTLVRIGVGSRGADDAAVADDGPRLRHGGLAKPEGEATALRWGVGDGSLEIDYLDVRLVQSSFLLPLFVSAEGLLRRCQPVNGLNFRLGSLSGISQADQSWISCASMRDLHELDISGAEFSSPDVVCVLWSPRLVYFTQRPELRQVDSQLDDILSSASALTGLAADLPASSPARAGPDPLDLRVATANLAGAGAGPAGHPLLQRNVSIQRGRAMSDLLDPGMLGRPGTSGSTGSETDSVASAVHRRNTSMPWTVDTQGTAAAAAQPGTPGPAALEGPGLSPEFGDPRTPVSAMSYKSSFHLLEIARQRRLTVSTSRNSVGRTLSPVQSPRRTGSEHDLVEMQRQGSFQVDPSAGQAARMAPTGPDPNVIMRDSRSTQASLLLKRKHMLGKAIGLEQAALAQLSSEFEQAPGRHNEYYRERMLQHAEHIYELSARRKLINRCMAVLGVCADGAPAGMDACDPEDVDFDRDTQEVEKVLASLYRHRCLIYSGYLIWTTQVRDKLMRFLYVQDCLTAVEYYMSEAAAGVVRKATAPASSSGGGSGKKTSSSPSVATVGSGMGAGRAAKLPDAARPEGPGARPPPMCPPPLRHRSGSQHSNVSSSTRRGLLIPKLLRRMHSQDGASSAGKGAQPSSRTARKKRRSPATAAAAAGSGYSNRFERGLSKIWDDFNRYQPYYSILVEFLNSQVSLRVDEGTSTRSAIAVAERVQLHRILLCDEDYAPGAAGGGGGGSGSGSDGSGGIAHNAPPTDETVVMARSMVELENVQVFTVNRDDFENRAAYFVDCTYGSSVEDSDTQPAALWPAWVPIELLLDQGTDKTRGIFDESDQQPEGGDGGSQSGDGSHQGGGPGAKYGSAWWLEDLSKYKRLMNRDSGLLVYDRANPLRIQGNADGDSGRGAQLAARVRARTATGDDAVDAAGTDGGMGDDGLDEASSSEEEEEDSSASDDGQIGDEHVSGSGHGMSHHANHIAVFLPELNLACTAEQYTTAYEIVTELLVFIDPEKAAYMDHLNTIQLSMDVSDLRGLLSVIRATQSALRERIPMIHDWYTLQRGWATQSRRGGDGAWARPPAAALLTLGRHRQALELQLRTALDLFGAAQKQKRQQLREPWTGAEHGARSHSPQRSPDGAEDEGRPSQQGGGGGVRRRAEESNNAIARTIRLFINKAAWHMLENDGQPMCDVILRWASLRAVTMSDQATHLVSEVHLLYVINRQPDPMFTDLVGPYVRPRDPVPDFCVQKMLRVQWSELAPVGGITIVERFEVDLHPLRLQLSYDIAQKLVNYLYPPQDASAAAAADAATGPPRAPSRRQRRPTEASFAPDDAEPATATGASASSISGTPLDDSASAHSPSASGAASPRSFTPARPTAAGGSGRSLLAARMRQRAAIPPSAPAEGRRASSEGPLLGLAAGDLPQPLQHSVSGLVPGATGHTGPTPLLPESGSMMNLPQGGDNRDQIDEMKKRASSNKTFLNVKIGGSTLCISYQGRRANNITDLRDFEFRAPTLELRNEVESYFELLMQVKREYRSVVVQHTGALVKEKLRQLHNRKAWSKTSSGPDWAARRLLISMDRRIDQERQANLGAALHDAAAVATPVSPLPPPPPPHVPAPTAPSSQASSASSAASSPPPTTKGAKPPSSKYMILDPRKLMGKRLPSMLPRSLPPLGFGRSEPPSPRPRQEDSGGRAMSCEPSGATASDSAAPASATQGLRALYSAMHIDMFPAAATAGESQSRPATRPAPPLQRRFTASATSSSSPSASPRATPAELAGGAQSATDDGHT